MPHVPHDYSALTEEFQGVNTPLTRLHFSRMRTAHALTVSPSMLWAGGCTWSQGGVPGPGGCTWSQGGAPGPGGVYLVPGGVPGL